MKPQFSEKAQNVINSLPEIARESGSGYVGSEHLLTALCACGGSIAQSILNSYEITADKLKSRISAVNPSDRRLTDADVTPKLQSMLDSIKAPSGRVGTEHLLIAVCEERECAAYRLIESLGAAPSDVRSDAIACFPTADGNRAKRNSSTPTLDAYGKNLTQAASEGRLDPVIGREKETGQVIKVLSRRLKNNPLLIGDAGVGKTAIAEGLAQRICSGSVPGELLGTSLISLDIAGMVSGAKYRGEFEERLKNAVSEASRDGILLFIDEIHNLVGAGAAEGAIDAANILKPALARGEIRIIGATTSGEYRKSISRDAALDRRFQPVYVPEPTEAEAVELLRELRPRYEQHHGVSISDGALDAAVSLSVRYITDRFLPDKAIDLIDEACSQVRINASGDANLQKIRVEKAKAVLVRDTDLAYSLAEAEKKYLSEKSSNSDLTVTGCDIAEAVESRTGIPVSRLTESDSERLSGLEAALKAKVIGQDEAVEKVARAVVRSRVGISDVNRPVGSFLFLGQTGVGKTLLCRVLAERLFGSEKALIRFDMSEYMEKHSVSRLIGSPPGYVGYGEGGLLTEKVHRRPYSVLLFDELEKAHPDILNLLLQVLDEGFLTDSQGNKVNFKNAVIIMTSNLGASSPSRKAVGFETDVARGYAQGVLNQVKQSFRPEFLNRIDDITVFSPLSRESIRKILKNMLSEVSRRAERLEITLIFDKSAEDLIAACGYSSEYGARQLRRTITTLYEDKIAAYAVDGKIKPGDTVTAYAENGQPALSVENQTID